MASTPEIRVSQAGAMGVAGGGNVEVAQAGVMAVAIWPTEFIQVSNAQVGAVTEASTDLAVSQAGVMVVGRGRVQDPVLRAWSFELDNHWYYVLRLPTGYTLVYDVATEQWYVWGSSDSLLWRPFQGTNWLGAGPLMGAYGSNIVCGDDGNGSLYLLNPNLPTDDDAVFGAEMQRTFARYVTGQVAVRNRNYVQCYGVRLMGSIGENELTNVQLFTSDDEGHTYDDQGVVEVSALDFDARVDWVGGLGAFTAPGRLFRIVDDGALQRIDWLEMMDGNDG